VALATEGMLPEKEKKRLFQHPLKKGTIIRVKPRATVTGSFGQGKQNKISNLQHKINLPRLGVLVWVNPVNLLMRSGI
jgi:hypothetical protein